MYISLKMNYFIPHFLHLEVFHNLYCYFIGLGRKYEGNVHYTVLTLNVLTRFIVLWIFAATSGVRQYFQVVIRVSILSVTHDVGIVH